VGDERKNERTRYVVLVKTDDDESIWEVLDTVEATTSARAKGMVAEKLDREGIYIAIPARSWNPETVVLERVPRAKVGK
jgi:hypothetical protein